MLPEIDDAETQPGETANKFIVPNNRFMIGTDVGIDDQSVVNESESEDENVMDDYVDRVSTVFDDDEEFSDHENYIFRYQDIISAMYDTSASIVLKVAAIALFFKLPMTAINAILALLRFLNHDVPKDARTVLKTQRTGPTTNDFEHIGLKSQLIKKITTNLASDLTTRAVLLDVNIDGIPLFKSSNITSWPILVRICNFGECKA